MAVGICVLGSNIHVRWNNIIPMQQVCPERTIVYDVCRPIRPGRCGLDVFLFHSFFSG